jgi:hypothetical protein
MKTGLQILIASLMICLGLILSIPSAFAAEAGENKDTTEARGNVTCPDGKCAEGSPVSDGPTVGKGRPVTFCQGGPTNGVTAEQDAELKARNCTPTGKSSIPGKGGSSPSNSATGTANK